MKKSNKAIIRDIMPGSIAEEVGIEPGDGVISINNEKVIDIFDYRYLIANEYLTLEVEKKDGEVWEIEIEKDEYEDLGMEFENSMIDDEKSCTNKCIFCFIDQMPEDMRESLYFKDDDSRLSFLTGNYVTLTNISFDDIDRIIKYRMSPINVSVHTTDPDIRVFMLKNRFAGDVIEKIKRLVEGGIEVNCQIVLCRGINDGSNLDKTLSDLSSLYPGVKSISVVPVGITRYRDGLCDLEPFDAAASQMVLEQVGKWQTKLYDEFDSRVVYLADEFYIMAGAELPEYEHYEDFPQLENGVGLVSMLRREVYEYLESLPGHSEGFDSGLRHLSLATGTSPYKYIKEMLDELQKKYNNIKVELYEIKNIFFGENVTVTGLITGGDLVSQLKGKELGAELLICKCMLKAGEKVFLDDFTVETVEKELGVKVVTVENTGKDFVDKVVGKTG